MRRDFFSTSVARPPVQQLAASTAPVLVPVNECPAHAPAGAPAHEVHVGMAVASPQQRRSTAA